EVAKAVMLEADYTRGKQGIAETKRALDACLAKVEQTLAKASEQAPPSRDDATGINEHLRNLARTNPDVKLADLYPDEKADEDESVPMLELPEELLEESPALAAHLQKLTERMAEQDKTVRSLRKEVAVHDTFVKETATDGFMQKLQTQIGADFDTHDDLFASPTDRAQCMQDVINRFAQSGDAREGKPIKPHIEAILKGREDFRKVALQKLADKHRQRKAGSVASREGPATPAQKKLVEDLEDWMKDQDAFNENLAATLGED
ncbi:MAG TPA: hypothetical protein VMW52_06825, partial [Phycisphaerae bacterium]|nr:hypothetical protein [Phycisphaerae bacterium]